MSQASFKLRNKEKDKILRIFLNIWSGRLPKKFPIWPIMFRFGHCLSYTDLSRAFDLDLCHFFVDFPTMALPYQELLSFVIESLHCWILIEFQALGKMFVQIFKYYLPYFCSIHSTDIMNQDVIIFAMSHSGLNGLTSLRWCIFSQLGSLRTVCLID